MAAIDVILELRHSKRRARDADEALAARASMTLAKDGKQPPKLSSAAAPGLSHVKLDAAFSPVQLPGRCERKRMSSRDVSAAFDPDLSPEASTYLVRGQVDEKNLGALEKECKSADEVVGLFADVKVRPFAICPFGPIGDDDDVEDRLCVEELHASGMDGTGVLVAIVDTGVSRSWLQSKGKFPAFDAARSWVPDPSLTPFQFPRDHGTMCAYDACIAAPNCTLLDIALLQSTRPGGSAMDGFLSDAVLAYRHLLDLMTEDEGRPPSLVVNNSWGMYHPSWDFPPGHPGNFSDNPNHPFNRIVGTLERAGADILFAAGNCGADCPDGRCQGVTDSAIYGANSHDQVLCVAGATIHETRVGYSSQGPGRLVERKPDLTGYTHFRGSGVYTADSGTSAATPVVAGVIAALRSQRPYDPNLPESHPAAMRDLLRTTARDIGPSGYDFDHGHGIVDACAAAERILPEPEPEPEPDPDPQPEPDPDPDGFWEWFCWHFPWFCFGSGTTAAGPRGGRRFGGTRSRFRAAVGSRRRSMASSASGPPPDVLDAMAALYDRWRRESGDCGGRRGSGGKGDCGCD